MKYFFLGIFLCASSIILAQESPENIHSIVLQEGDMFEFGKVSVRFKEVIADSRCPIDVTCVWAGEATILLEIYENGKFLEDKIVSSIFGNSIQQFFAEGNLYTISGIQLLPYPESKSSKKTEYTLCLDLSDEL